MSIRLDKAVDTILEDYNPLDLSVIQNHNSITMSTCKLWRLNLCAVSNEIPCTFYIAMNYRIKVYTLDTISSPFKDPIKIIASSNALELGGGSESPFIINAIKVGRMLEKEVLVSVSENGEVCIWRTENLDAPPLILNNHIATWGVTIHGGQGLLAVSANNYKVTVYNLLEMTKDNPIFGRRPDDEPNHLGSIKSISLVGHEDNIPSIDFDESGRYIASASIDSTCKIWDITTRQVVTETKGAQRGSSRFAEQDAWCWSAKFIKPGNFKYAVCTDKEVTKLILSRICQDRSTSLPNLGLCHSAAHPAFPMNMSRIFDLEEEDADFEIYEGEEEGDLDASRWDEALMDQANEYVERVFGLQIRGDDLDAPPYIQVRSDTENIDGAESYPSIFQERGSTQEEPGDFRRPPVGDSSGTEWTITNSPITTGSGWGDYEASNPDNSENSGAEARFDITARSTSNQWPIGELLLSESEEDELPEPEQSPTSRSPVPSYCIPNIIRTTSSSSLSKMNIGPKTPKAKRKDSMGQYLMITSGKDVILASTSIPRIRRIRIEHNIISKMDIRSDPLLTASDRINMVEWLPELELFVAASQNGTVALMRVIQIDLNGKTQCCIFNNEHYLPNDVLQSTPLYGMTVKKVQEERFACTSYQIFLFYYNGNVLAYNLSRKDSDITVEDLIF